MAQRRLAPVPQRQEGLQRPVGRADEQAPAGAHHGQIGRGFAARQGDELAHGVVQVARAVGHAAQQGGAHGGRIVRRVAGGGLVGRGQAQRGQARLVVGGGLGRLVQQQGVGQAVDVGRHVAVDAGDFAQSVGMVGRLAHAVEVELAGHQVVAHLQHHDQHAGQHLAARRARRFQHHVARGLQLIGQCGLAPQQVAQAGRRVVAGAARWRRHAPCVRAQQCRHGQQQIGRELRAVARVEHGVRNQGIDHVQRAAQAAVKGAHQRLARAGGQRRGHREQHHQHHADGHRRAALAPRHAEEGQKGGRHQKQPQPDRVAAQQLHRQKQRHADERRHHQMHQLAAPWSDQIGRQRRNHAHRGIGGRLGAEQQVHDGRHHEHAERARGAVEHVVAQQDAQHALAPRGAEPASEHVGLHVSATARAAGSSSQIGLQRTIHKREQLSK